MSASLPSRVRGWGLAGFLAGVALVPWLAPNAYIIQVLAFTGLNVANLPGQAPVLADALGYLFCRVAGRVAAGDHDLLIAAVEGGKTLRPDGRP